MKAKITQKRISRDPVLEDRASATPNPSRLEVVRRSVKPAGTLHSIKPSSWEFVLPFCRIYKQLLFVTCPAVGVGASRSLKAALIAFDISQSPLYSTVDISGFKCQDWTFCSADTSIATWHTLVIIMEISFEKKEQIDGEKVSPKIYFVSNFEKIFKVENKRWTQRGVIRNFKIDLYKISGRFSLFVFVNYYRFSKLWKLNMEYNNL